ncbi:uncharacterized protein LOC125870045 [Solanum stenotomum]|uniref:uncharacterized protein LOC125870045 n=1 Tax=Solanum stenotomum TaxID=172797 RepID=UPI0020D0AA69|nr:uncharacterized protein LOC125870045 [Solanum stenotomum]
MVIGDFNSILKTDDRIGGNPVSWSEIVDFHECVTDCGLLEVPTQGNRYTWSDKHDGNRIFSKIDWIFINNEWLDTMFSCKAMFLPEGISDHCPAKVILSENCGEKTENVKKEVEGAACTRFPEYCSRGNSGQRKIEQRSKATWIRLGDDNTKYFYSVIKHRKLKHATTQLKNNSGVWQNDPAIIANLIVEYYQDILGNITQHRVQAVRAIICQRTTLTQEQQRELIDSFDPTEVKKEMYQIDSNKSPGPDGLKKAISCIVAENQSAFVQGRSMMHNVLICHDLLRHYNRKNVSPRCLMKIDLKKAYDMVSWEFLEEVLTGFRFPEGFIKWIMMCVTTTMFYMKVNGENHGYFAGRRGLRQGDPASPLLFVLVMEYLSRTLRNMSMLPDFKYHPMCKKVQLTHLIFADDLMIFCKGNLASVSRVMEALAHFSAATGLEANMEKSSVFIAGVDEDTKAHILERTGFSLGEFPIRLQVVNVVLFSIHNFWGAVFILPQSILKEIDMLCRDYLWGRSDEKRKIALVSWENVCYPKRQCGLNIKGSRTCNIASVGQLIWQIIMHKESLWVKWIHGIYLKHEMSIWNHRVPIDCSWYWRKLNAIKEQMKGWYCQGRYMLTKNGTYSITRSYLAIKGQRQQLETADLVWTAVALPKHRFMVWLAIQGRLLTQERKLKLHIQVDDTECCLCEEKVMETTKHLFEECKWSKMFLDGIKEKHWKQFKKETIATISGAVLYHTWRARNWKKYKGKNVNTKDAVIQIKKEITERIQFLSNSKKAQRCRGFIQHLLCN